MNDPVNKTLRPYFIELLDQKFKLRQVTEPGYSHRHFARDLNVDSSALNRIFRGKQAPTLKIADQLAKALKMTDEDRFDFFISIGRARTLRLAAELTEFVHQDVTPEILAVAESDSISARASSVSEQFDFEIYKSVIKILPGFALVLDPVGRIVLRNELLSGFTIAQLDRTSDFLSEQLNGSMNFECELRLTDIQNQDRAETFRFGAIRSQQGELNGWLVTSLKASSQQHLKELAEPS